MFSISKAFCSALAALILIFASKNIALSDSVVATIMISGPAYGLAINSKTNKIYLSVLSLQKTFEQIQSTGTSEEVIIIDGATDTISTSFAIQPVIMSQDVGLDVNSETNKLYISNQINNRILIVDTNSPQNGVINTVTGLGFESATLMGTSLAVNSKTNKVYIVDDSSSLAHSLYILDGLDNMLTSIPLSLGSPQGIGIDIENNKIFIPKFNPSTLAVIDGGTNTESANIFTIADSPKKVAINPTTNKVYVVDELKNSITIIDETKNEITGSIMVGNSPFGVAVNSTTNKIYVTNSGSDNVSVIDGKTSTVVSTINTDPNPKSIAVNTTTNKIYVANFGTKNTITVIDGSNPINNSSEGNASPSSPTGSSTSTTSSGSIPVTSGGTNKPVIMITGDLKNILNDFDDNLIVLGQASSQANLIVQKIRILIQTIKSSVFQSTEICSKTVVSTLGKINSSIQLFEKKRCKSTTKTSKCIPSTVLDRFLPTINESLQSVQTGIVSDKNNDGIYDLCQQ